jgi:hypothetical protein
MLLWVSNWDASNNADKLLHLIDLKTRTVSKKDIEQLLRQPIKIERNKNKKFVITVLMVLGLQFIGLEVKPVSRSYFLATTIALLDERNEHLLKSGST